MVSDKIHLSSNRLVTLEWIITAKLVDLDDEELCMSTYINVSRFVGCLHMHEGVCVCNCRLMYLKSTNSEKNWLCDLFKTCSSSTHGSTEKEKTLAIIKPDGLLGNYTDDIKKTILEYGFSILKEKTVQLDEETVKRFYAEHSSKSFFSSLIKYMTRYPLIPWCMMVTCNISLWLTPCWIA